MIESQKAKIKALLNKGVRIPNPESIEIGDDVNPDRIAGAGVVIHTGCKISGADTLILENAILGEEAPVTVENCCIGRNVSLKGGFFRKAVFLDSASAGSGAHVREGTILEEQASIAHTVGLKQTILFPFVTLGSLINFCDIFMAGGTNRKNHSEVGSSYIHFNFSANQDKATPSLVGEVPHGVMLKQPPIFLGGQGGLVGPCRLWYGTTIAAGSIYRKDELRPGRLIIEGGGRGGNIPFSPGFYRSVKRIVLNNLLYIANLMALSQWIRYVRYEFISDSFPEDLWRGLSQNIELALFERIKRLKALSEEMPISIDIYRTTAGEKASEKLIRQKKELYERWGDVEAAISSLKSYDGEPKHRDSFLGAIQAPIQSNGKNYLLVIQSLDGLIAEVGTRWLQGIVDHVVNDIYRLLPSFGYDL